MRRRATTATARHAGDAAWMAMLRRAAGMMTVGGRHYTTSGTIAHPDGRAHVYSGLEDLVTASSQLRPTPAGQLQGIVQTADLEALWGHSTPVHPHGATKANALHLWLAMGMHPTLSLPTPDCLRTTEDAVGTDLSTPEIDHLRESIALWTNVYNERHARSLRLMRHSGASQVGLLREAKHDDEADHASTTWAQDKEFLRALVAIGDILPEKPANLEQLELALRRCTAEQYLALVEAQFPATSPFPFAPVPTSARWHFTDDALKEWAIDYQSARLEAGGTVDMLRGAVESRKWEPIAEALGQVAAKIAAIAKRRWARQAAAGIVPADWHAASLEQKQAVATAWADRIASGLLNGELDPAHTADTSAEWIQENEEITALGNTEVASGLTFAAVWKATTRLEALEFKHLYVAPLHRATHAACLRRLLDEDGFDALADAEAVVLAHSSFSPRNGDIVPAAGVGMPTAQLPAVWLKANWWRFCGAGTVTQVSPLGSRQLGSNYLSLECTASIVGLHYALRPLSASIDYSTPLKHRTSLVRALTAQSLSQTRAGQRANNELLRTLYATEDDLSAVASALAWPLGVQRRKQTAERRQRLRAKLFDVTDVKLVPASDAAQVAAREALGVADKSAWVLGSSRTVKYEWEPATKRADNTSSSNPVAQILEREAAARSVGIEVTLWRKKSSSNTPNVRLQQEADRLKRAHGAVAATPQLKSVVAQVAWDLARITGSKDAAVASELPASVVNDHVDAAGNEAYEFAAVLDDNHIGSRSGELVVHLCKFNNGVGNQPATHAPVEPGTYRLRVRCFQHDVNPAHDPGCASDGYTADFEVVDVLDKALELHGAGKTTLPAANFMAFFEQLRAAGLSVTTALEFEAGQALDVKGDALVSRIKELVETGQFALVGARNGISAAQCDLEPRIRRHWEIENPGATEEEWLTARRSVLERAITTERDWWYPDELLDTTYDATTDATMRAEANMRYAHDYVSVLEASGAAGTLTVEGEPRAEPVVQAAYSGTGAVTSLKFASDACIGRSLDDLLALATEAVDRSQVRLNTLAAARINVLDRTTRYHVIDTQQLTAHGGVYAGTYMDAYRRAMNTLGESGELAKRTVIPSSPPTEGSAPSGEAKVASP